MPTPIPAFAGLEKNACLQQTGTHYFRNINIYVGRRINKYGWPVPGKQLRSWKRVNLIES